MPGHRDGEQRRTTLELPLLAMPLKFIPSSFGSWALKAGVQFLKLNSNLRLVNGNDGFVPIGSVGLSLTY